MAAEENWWKADRVVAKPNKTQQVDGGVYVPPAPEKPEKPREAPSGYRYNAEGNVEFIPGGPADPAIIAQESAARRGGEKTFPEGAANKLTEDVGQVEALTRALNGFQDDFAGSFLAGAESALQGVGLDFGMATPGQRNWWADFNSTDNIIRNKLFGSTLTDGEKAAYLATTIAPSSDPQIIKENLQKRLDIIKKATERRYNRYIAAGYNPAEVDATVGDVDFRILPEEAPTDTGAGTGAEPGTEAELVEFETNPDLVVGKDGKVYNIKTGEVVLLPSQGEPTGTDIGQSLYAAGGDIAQTAGDVLGLVGNPANAAVNALLGTNLSTNLGETFREATGAPRGDPLASAINRGLGAAMTGLGGASLAARTLPQAGRQIASTLTQLPTQQIVGGGTGAAASEVVRQQGGGPVAQTIAGIAGGVTPAAIVRPRPTSVPTTATAPTTSAMEALVSPPTARDIIRAGEQANIPIMTSDIRQPTTFLGATAQRAGERIPLVGTGGARATQQQARQDAVQDFLVENAGAVPADVEAKLVADVIRKNADNVQKYSNAKKEVFAKVSSAGPVATTNTMKAIDDQIAKLSSLKTDAADEAVVKLQELRDKVGDRDIYQMESFRKDELGNAWQDTNLSIGASNRVRDAVKSLYGPFNEDIGQYILKNGDKRDYTQWRVSNARLSEGINEANRNELKAILRKGEATPELIDRMLFSSKKSDVSALYRALTPDGQALARMAVVNRVAKDIGAAQGISPEKFVSKMINRADQIGVFFSKGQQQEIKGLIQALNATRRGGSAAVQTQSGQENYIPIVLSALGAGADVLTTGGTGTALAAAFTGAVRAYESKPVRNLFAALAKTKSGSEQEQAIIGKINEKFAPIVATLSSIEAEAEKAKKEQRTEMPQ